LQNYLDISPDGRQVILASQNLLEPNISMIENGGAERP